MTPRQSKAALTLEPNPLTTNVADAFVVDGESAYHVWALIGHYLATGRSVTRLAEDYDLAPETAAELVRQYEENEGNLRFRVDARLAENSDAFVA